MTMTMTSDSKTQRAYVRELPGGGFVAIDVTPATSLLPGRHFHGAIVVERRAYWRREGHSPVEVADATGKSVGVVVQELLPTAESNPAIGAALLRRNLIPT
jgi:hypothetical protein